MATYTITSKELSKALSREAKGVRRKIERGALRAAHRGKALLVRKTDEKGITDLGQFKNSFQVERGAARGIVAELWNDAPHAGIIELGPRPHPVSREGWEAIREWVARKMLELSADLAD